jgi:hypothetical protein
MAGPLTHIRSRSAVAELAYVVEQSTLHPSGINGLGRYRWDGVPGCWDSSFDERAGKLDLPILQQALPQVPPAPLVPPASE